MVNWVISGLNKANHDSYNGMCFTQIRDVYDMVCHLD